MKLTQSLAVPVAVASAASTAPAVPPCRAPRRVHAPGATLAKAKAPVAVKAWPMLAGDQSSLVVSSVEPRKTVSLGFSMVPGRPKAARAGPAARMRMRLVPEPLRTNAGVTRVPVATLVRTEMLAGREAVGERVMVAAWVVTLPELLVMRTA